MFAAMRSLVVAALGVGLAAPVADAEPIHSGMQPAPPVHVGEPTLSQDLEQRRNIRGCNASETCTRLVDQMRELELVAFPAPGKSPWLDERTPPGSRIEAVPVKRVKRPSELRPDQPWLDKLELPDLPVTWTQKLVDYLMFYKDDPRGRSIMSSWLVAQGRYRDLIVSICCTTR